ncbi:MAG: sulfur carrier protein ThiS [Bacteroidales bacterium]|nr:sulfur carrier protein ThiS [Bacteroidales bacterium]
MNITINKNIVQVKENSTLKEVIVASGINSQLGMAVAVNNEVITKSKWDTFCLKENDNIVVINAVCGG